MTFEDKLIGCWYGGAIGDAMGGPIESLHYKRIQELHPDLDDFVPIRVPPGVIYPGQGYVLDDEPGNVTDDTYIRADLARFLMESEPPYNAAAFVKWIPDNVDLMRWWRVALYAVRRINKGDGDPETYGRRHPQGGGGGWWQPVAALYKEDIDKASEATRNLCCIWKAPLEQDILSSVVAGHAEAFREGASIDSIVNTVIENSGPLARKLFERAVSIAQEATSRIDLYEKLYAHCFVDECSTEIDGPMPDHVEPLDYTDKTYTSWLFAEQQPLALAFLVFGKGDGKETILTAAKFGRDADSITTNAGSYLGALAGEACWPKNWVETVQNANISRIDIRQSAIDFAAFCERS